MGNRFSERVTPTTGSVRSPRNKWLLWVAMVLALLAVVLVPTPAADAIGAAPDVDGLDGRVVQLVNVETKRYLDGNTDRNVDQTYAPSEGDLWRFERVPGSAAVQPWRLYNIERSGYLTAEGAGNGYNVGLSDASDESTQWELSVLDDGSFLLQSVADGRYLDADGPSQGWNVDTSTGGDEPDTHWRLGLADGAAGAVVGDLFGYVIQLQNVDTKRFADGNTDRNVDQSWAPSNGDRWLVTEIGGGYVTLYNLERPGLLTAGDRGDHYNAYLSDRSDDSVKWKITSDGDGSHVLENAATGRYLDADGRRSHWNVDTTTKRNDRDTQWRINIIDAPPPDTQPPSQPAAFGVPAQLVELTSLTAVWEASFDNVAVVGYRLFRDGVEVAEVDANTQIYTFGGLQPETLYDLGIEAFDAAGNTSRRATTIGVTLMPPDTEPPTAPLIEAPVAEDIGESTFTMSWAPSTDNRGVVGYTVYIFGVPFRDLDATDTTYTFTGLESEVEFTFGISAFDAAGNVSPISEVTITTLEACGTGADLQRLLDCVTLDAMRAHQRAFQDHADANDGHREASSQGFKDSVTYAINEFTAAGYEVREQVFDYPVFTELAPAELSQVSPVAKDYEYFGQTDQGFATMSYSGSGSGTADAQAVDTIDPTGQPPNTSTSGCEPEDFDTFVAGNIAIVQRGACSFAQKAFNAQTAGAIGVVIYNEGQDGRTDNFLGTLGPDSGVTIPVVGSAYQVGVELGAADVVASIFASTQTEILTSSNILADHPGGGDRGDTIMVGAHLDSVLAGPGIQDNGTGSAAVLEVAKQMANATPDNHLRFVLWGAEESGLIGSEYYVTTIPDAEFNGITAYLNFDMIGSPNHFFGIYDGDDSDAVGAPAGPPGSAEIEVIFEDYYTLNGYPFQGTDFSGRSDYGPFIAFGIPSGGLFTGAEGIKTFEEAALYGGIPGEAYDPCYHLACDTFDNINLDAYEVNGDAVAYATWTLAYSDLLPPPAPRAALDRSTYGTVIERYVHLHVKGMHAYGS